MKWLRGFASCGSDFCNRQVTAAIEDLVPVAIAMLPVNAAVYVLDGCLVGASDFKYLAGAPLLPFPSHVMTNTHALL